MKCPKKHIPTYQIRVVTLVTIPQLTLEKEETGTILKNSWASSSVRIEHQPPKLGVEGSNPSPPATNKPRPFFGS